MLIIALLVLAALICFGLGFVVKWLFIAAAVLLLVGLMRLGVNRGSRSRT